MTAATEPLLLHPAEAGRMLGLGRRTVYEMCARGELPVVRIGRSVRVPVDGLGQWVEAHTEYRETLIETLTRIGRAQS